MEEINKPTRLEKMRDALKNKPKAVKTEKKQKTGKVAAAATPAKVADGPPVPKKPNHRAAKARDERAKKRGRMPVGSTVHAAWDGTKWVGSMVIPYSGGLGGYDSRVFTHESDGLFRLMEELDVTFWQWYAKEATDEEKKRLVFALRPPAPARWPYPEGPESTAVESH